MPKAAPVTVTAKKHWVPGAMLAPDMLIPVGLVNVTVPPHTVALAFGTVRPTGRVSVKPIPVSVSGLVAGLVMVKLRALVLFSAIGFGLKDVPSVGGALTLRPADAMLPVPPLVDVTFPVVFVYELTAVPVTVTLKLQLLLAAMLAPENVMVDGAVSVTVPPQTPALAFGTVSPVGRISVKPTPVSATVLLGLVVEKFRDVVVPRGIEGGVKDFVNTGGPTTVMDALPVLAPPPVNDT